MSAAKKDNFLFESEDSDQQILPFDFLDEEEEEEEEKESTVTDNSAQEEKAETAPAEAEEKTETVDDKEDEQITDTSESSEPETAEEEAEETADKDKKAEAPLPETVKLTAPDKKEQEIKTEKPAEEKAEQRLPSGIKPGQVLQEARVRKDLSIDQVSQNTKIKKKFINALEEGDEGNLPAAVYVEAYVKSLAKLYDIDAKPILNGLIRPKLGKMVPGELLSHIEEGKQVNFEEEAKVNKFFKIAIVFIVIIALAVLLLVKFSSKKTSTGEEVITTTEETTTPAPEITSEDLEVFITPKPFTMTEMAIPNPSNN